MTEDLEPTLKVAKSGKPYSTEAQANNAIRLSSKMDAEDFEPVPHEGGWAIARKVGGDVKEKPEQTATDKGEKEEFWVVKFHAMSRPNDKKRVELGVQGFWVTCDREVQVTLPYRYIVCADNATLDVYDTDPNKSRMVTGRLRKYPYDIINREGDPADFDRLMAEGRKSIKEEAEKVA